MSEAKVESPYFSETERKAQVCGLLYRLREKLKKLRVEEQSLVAEIGKLENEEAKREQEAKSKEQAAKFEDFKAGKITGTLWIDPFSHNEATYLCMSATSDNFAVKAWGDPDPVWIKSDFKVFDGDLRYFMLQL